MSDHNNNGYEVGYGKPPKSGQFKPGQSGNPGGKKAGKRSIKHDLDKALSAPAAIKFNGKTIKGTNQSMALLTLATRAGAGDVKAQALLLPFVMQVFGPDDRSGTRRTLSSQDQALFDDIMADRCDGVDQLADTNAAGDGARGPDGGEVGDDAL